MFSLWAESMFVTTIKPRARQIADTKIQVHVRESKIFRKAQMLVCFWLFGRRIIPVTLSTYNAKGKLTTETKDNRKATIDLEFLCEII